MFDTTRIFSRTSLWSHFSRFSVPQLKSGRKRHNILISRVFVIYLKFRALAGEGARFIDKVTLLLPPDFSFQGWFMYTRCPFDPSHDLTPPAPAHDHLAGCCPESRPLGVASVHDDEQYISSADCQQRDILLWSVSSAWSYGHLFVCLIAVTSGVNDVDSFIVVSYFLKRNS